MRSILIAAMAAGCATGSAHAGPLLGAGYASTGIYTFDTSTGAATSIAGSGNIDNGLGYNSATGVLYGLQNQTLYTIDVATGVRTQVATTAGFVTELEYNPLDGLMYTLNKSSGNGNAIAVIDTTTGAVTNIGAGINNGQYHVAFAINGLGEAYVAGLSNGSLYRVDLSTGVYSLVGNMGINGLTAMAFDDQGTLFGVTTYTDTLGIIDTGTGLFSALGGYNGIDMDVRAMEFIGDKRGPVNGVPEPGTLALAGLALAALTQRRRRR